MSRQPTIAIATTNPNSRARPGCAIVLGPPVNAVMTSTASARYGNPAIQPPAARVSARTETAAKRGGRLLPISGAHFGKPGVQPLTEQPRDGLQDGKHAGQDHGGPDRDRRIQLWSLLPVGHAQRCQQQAAKTGVGEEELDQWQR